MPITDPFRADVEVALREPVRHLHKVTAYRPGDDPYEDGTVLDLVTATVEIGEDSTPRFRFNGSVGLVEDQDVLDLLDPRMGTRLLVEAGYRYADARTELRPLCDVGIRERVVRRPQGDVVIVAVSDEAIVQDYVSPETTYPAGAARTTVLASLLGRGHQQAVNILSSRLGGSLDAEGLVVAPDGTWSAVQAILDTASAEAYHDGLTGFYVTDQPVGLSASSASLATGRDGTITMSEVATDLEEFANYVLVALKWSDSAGVERTNYGVAEQNTGPLGTSAIGRRGRYVELQQRGTGATATQIAWSILVRTLSRGRRVHVEDAVARYWLRPGHAITIRLPLGPPERAVVSRVTFNLPAGSMSVHTRQPETTSAPI